MASLNKCPLCGSNSSDVKDVRELSPIRGIAGITYPAIRRRHACKDCGGRYTTIQMNEDDYLRLLSERNELVSLRQAISAITGK